jgi:hypothetical protein
VARAKLSEIKGYEVFRVDNKFLYTTAPFGIDETVIKTVSTWKCKPAMLEGKPADLMAQTNFPAGGQHVNG